jgi:propanol-preferring alcohol dehydrogenase
VVLAQVVVVAGLEQGQTLIDSGNLVGEGSDLAGDAVHALFEGGVGSLGRANLGLQLVDARLELVERLGEGCGLSLDTLLLALQGANPCYRAGNAPDRGLDLVETAGIRRLAGGHGKDQERRKYEPHGRGAAIKLQTNHLKLKTLPTVAPERVAIGGLCGPVLVKNRTMLAWQIAKPGPIASRPLQRVDVEVPSPAAGEVRVKVSACGVCRTDLHLAEGDLPPRRPSVIPGHEVVGVIDAAGEGADRFAIGDRVGIAWLGHTCGICRFCLSGRENLCLTPRFTGWDRDGGYAQWALADQDYVYSLPRTFDDEHAAPLLCAGIIGYRALRQCHLPPAGRLGIYGFGGSAHLAAQLAVAEGAQVHVITRSEAAQHLALELGASSARDPSEAPPEPLDSAIIFAPAGEVVPLALQALDRGGTVAIAGIHLSPIPALELHRHLFNERRLVSVTANTRGDGEEFIRLAARHSLSVRTMAFGMEQADVALAALAEGRVTGAAVLLEGG